MTHLLNLETLQFAAQVKEDYTSVLYCTFKLFNFVAKIQSSCLKQNLSAVHWPHNLANFPKSG